ncbi:hypothetical protein ACFSC1_07330 [Paracoccus aurantiacus]|uniref:hypothetical protein n=1 Tax=Paracoccus aurantiacus TaxID=2599412 RepID=UPI00164BAD54|nr:hypothetical protein [Paracoccus aurantiacus]
MTALPAAAPLAAVAQNMPSLPEMPPPPGRNALFEQVLEDASAEERIELATTYYATDKCAVSDDPDGCFMDGYQTCLANLGDRAELACMTAHAMGWEGTMNVRSSEMAFAVLDAQDRSPKRAEGDAFDDAVDDYFEEQSALIRTANGECDAKGRMMSGDEALVAMMRCHAERKFAIFMQLEDLIQPLQDMLAQAGMEAIP